MYLVPTYMPIFVLRLIFIRNVLFVNCCWQFYRLSLMRTMNYFFNYQIKMSVFSNYLRKRNSFCLLLKTQFVSYPMQGAPCARGIQKPKSSAQKILLEFRQKEIQFLNFRVEFVRISNQKKNVCKQKYHCLFQLLYVGETFQKSRQNRNCSGISEEFRVRI